VIWLMPLIPDPTTISEPCFFSMLSLFFFKAAAIGALSYCCARMLPLQPLPLPMFQRHLPSLAGATGINVRHNVFGALPTFARLIGAHLQGTPAAHRLALPG
jgi:hypothetical protein